MNRTLRSILVISVAIAGIVGVGFARAVPGAQVQDPIQLSWKTNVYRTDGKIPIELWTRQEPLVKLLQTARIVVTPSDGKERRLRSSATRGKPRIDSGRQVVDIDGGETAQALPAGQFSVTYEYEDKHRCTPLHGILVSPIADPVAELKKSDKDPKAKKKSLAALIETDDGNMLAELYPDKAPKTVANFVKLAADGFYNEKTIHRIVRGFMFQGGGYKADGSMSTSDAIPFEDTGVPHDRGVLSMARLDTDMNSATNQFFVCLVNNRTSLDGKYASFGKVMDNYGFDTMDKIALAPVSVAPGGKEKSKPNELKFIRKVTIVEKP
jgi:cyclophilin family peptidyl-prolyl cis-trans isomerase